MQPVKGGQVFSFNYVDFAGSEDLFVRGSVYDVTSGTAVFVQNVPMNALGLGLYQGVFNAQSDKIYLVISVVFTDGTFTTVDPNRAPAADTFFSLAASISTFAAQWAAYDKNQSLNVAMVVQDVTASPVHVLTAPMAHVAHGVYYASFSGAPNVTYEVQTAAFTDNTYTALDSLYSPDSDGFVSFTLPPSESISVSGPAVLVGQALSAELSGQSLNAILKEV